MAHEAAVNAGNALAATTAEHALLMADHDTALTRIAQLMHACEEHVLASVTAKEAVDAANAAAVQAETMRAEATSQLLEVLLD
jgi:hypothetical protein